MEQDANEECAVADRTFFISVINFLIFPYLPFKKINYKICKKDALQSKSYFVGFEVYISSVYHP